MCGVVARAPARRSSPCPSCGPASAPAGSATAAPRRRARAARRRRSIPPCVTLLDRHPRSSASRTVSSRARRAVASRQSSETTAPSTSTTGMLARATGEEHARRSRCRTSSSSNAIAVAEQVATISAARLLAEMAVRPRVDDDRRSRRAGRRRSRGSPGTAMRGGEAGGGADHRGVVGAERDRDQLQRGARGARRARRPPRAAAPLAATPPPSATARQLAARSAAHRASRGELADDRRLEAGGEVGAALGDSVARRGRDRGRRSAVFSPLKLKSRPRSRLIATGKLEGLGVAVARRGAASAGPPG